MSEPILKVVASLWENFEAKILTPINAGRVQRIETRRAFYAGAAGVIDAIMINAAKGTEVTTSDEELMNGIAQEFLDFAEDMARGRA